MNFTQRKSASVPALLALAAIVALLPVSTTLAEKPLDTVIQSGDSGFSLVSVETNTKQRTKFARANYNWPFASGPYYGDTASRQSGVLITPAGSFDLRGAIDIPEELRASVQLAGNAAQYFVLSVDQQVLPTETFDAIREAIQTAGGAIMQPQPVGSFLVRLNAGAHAALQGMPGVVAIEPYHPAFKLHPTIGRAPLPDPLAAVSDVYSLRATLFQGENAALVAQAIADLGGTVTAAGGDAVFFSANRNLLPAIAALEPVKQVFEELPNFVNAEETTTTMQTGAYNGGAVPYHTAGVTGEGQVIMVIDSGFSPDAGDLSQTDSSSGVIGPGHRKIDEYINTDIYPGGNGDTLSCDDFINGGSSHGHIVAATAMGNASDVAGAYGTPYFANDRPDGTGKDWKLDGVALKARVVAVDSQVTPAVGCDLAGIVPGDLYDGTPGNDTGALQDTYNNNGVRISNFSWGNSTNTYGGNAQDVDSFIFDRRDAMVFIAAGNDGTDADSNGSKDEGTLGAPATTKNGVAVGSVGNAEDTTGGTGPDEISFFSSMGPTTGGGRVAPMIMAPGQERGGMGNASEFACRSDDNLTTDNQSVQCDVVTGFAGTSFASPAAAGAALLMRDYFEEGFYPDATNQNPGNASDQVASISGALVKALMVASAEWVGTGNLLPQNGSQDWRFNNEQGYGRVQMNRAFPIAGTTAPVGLIVTDGDTGGIDDLGLSSGGVTSGGTASGTFTVCDVDQDLSVGLAWIDPVNGTGDLENDLDLRLISPSGKEYIGNFYTDDTDRGFQDPPNGSEDCPSFDGTANARDASPWSLEVSTCTPAVQDTGSCSTGNTSGGDCKNPTEGIHLSTDPNNDGNDVDSQIESGDWTIQVNGAGTYAGTQTFAAAVAGGVCLGSGIRYDLAQYPCNGRPSVTVNEVSETGDVAPTATDVSNRTTLEVWDVGPNGVFDGGTGDDVMTDSETGLTFTQPDLAALKFVIDKVIVTDGTAPDPGNGALDVASGNVLVAIYEDVDSVGAPDPNKVRRNQATVDCDVSIDVAGFVFATFGQNQQVLIEGGCETNARGKFEFGFPDSFIDEDERIGVRYLFTMTEQDDLEDATATLSCVQVDADSPAECLPGTNACADPNRANNPPCTEMTVLDSPKFLGRIPANSVIAANFTIEAANSIVGSPKVELVLGITAPASGKTVNGFAVSRTKLNVDENQLLYSTDYIGGGTEDQDWNNDEVLENPTTNIGDFQLDYRFESAVYSDATATGLNSGLSAPWSFNSNRGNHQHGWTGSSSDVTEVIANWGEDKDFDDTLDTGEDRDTVNGALDRNWSTNGGCGWQTTSGATGGIWKTGTIRTTAASTCSGDGGTDAECQNFERLTGTANQKTVIESLLTPVVEKVNQGVDAEGDPTHRVEISAFSWNSQVDLPDSLVAMVWELDTDASTEEPISVKGDGGFLNGFGGGYGAVTGGSNPQLTDGYPVFAPLDGTQNNTQNGSVGNNRVGELGCFFEGGSVSAENAGVLGFARPEDDDIDNNSAGGTDEYVTDAGPIRNFRLDHFNGPDMRFTVLEDFFGETGNSFQGAIGLITVEGTTDTQPGAGYGVAVDDTVIEWKEFELVTDTTDCAVNGACAVLELDTFQFFQGQAIIGVSLQDATPYDPTNPVNDCNLDGDFTDLDDDTDCDNDGTQDIVVKATSESEIAGEIVVLNQDASNTALYQGELSVSAVFDADGVLLIQRAGADLPTISVNYEDRDVDGTGTRCDNDVDPNAAGFIEVTTAVFYPVGQVSIVGTRLTDDNDNDGFADTNETVDMFLTVRNQSGVDLDNIVARATTNDSTVDCVLQPVINIGAIAADTIKEGPDPFRFRVASSVNRAGEFDDITATFNITMSSEEFDALLAPTQVTLDLDLNVSGGSGPSSFAEDFEVSGSFGQFTSQNLDKGKNNNTLSDGWRCQYNDPDWVGSNSYGITECYLGFENTFQDLVQNNFDWHQHGPADPVNAPDGGRGFTNNASLHLGLEAPGDPDSLTTTTAQMDAVRTSSPINLGYVALNGAAPELSFKHQISLMDNRTVNTPAGFAADRGVVHVQRANNLGTAQGDWVKLIPYQNVYDVQGAQNYSNCLLDPIDDGDNEDVFFDPSDPNRRTGPSSTCFPGFSFAFMGATDHRNPFQGATTNLGSAEGPGLQGSAGNGTWVESKFNLDRFQGRRVRLRFLFTSINLGPIPDYETAFVFNPDPRDDGWFIDDVRISNTLTSAATLSADGSGFAGSPCGATCNTVTGALSASTTLADAPGETVELDASASTADRCVDGTIQYQFWIVDASGVVGDAGDTLLRNWTDNPIYITAVNATTEFGVVARCSSDAACNGSATELVTVNCPSTGNIGGSFPETVIAQSNKTDYNWTSVFSIDAVEGSLNTLRSGGTFTGSVSTCLADDVSTNSVSTGTNPAAGDGIYVVVKQAGGGGACNAANVYSSGGTGEDPGRDSEINADGNSCP